MKSGTSLSSGRKTCVDCVGIAIGRVSSLAIMLLVLMHRANAQELKIFDRQYTPAAVTNDGIIAGTWAGQTVSTNAQRAFRKLPLRQAEILGTLPVGLDVYSKGRGISADGRIVVGTVETLGGWQTYQGFQWTADGGLKGLPRPASPPAVYPHGQAHAVSSDGSVIGGAALFEDGVHGVLWVNGLLQRHFSMAGVSPVVYAVSGDGRRSCGILNSNTAFMWGSSVQPIVAPIGSSLQPPFALSQDGSVMCLNMWTSNGMQAYRWDMTGGLQHLGGLPGNGPQATAFGISGDGATIVGAGHNTNIGWRPFLWTAATGMILLKDVASRRGINTTGWLPGGARAISPDGEVIAGIGQDWEPSWMLNLRVPCIGDINHDKMVDDSDFVLFVVDYDRLECEAVAMPLTCPSDFTRDGSVDDSDFQLFVHAYDQLFCD